MKFKTKQVQFRTLSRSRMVVGLILGVTYAFVFYSFLELLWKFFRLIQFSSGYTVGVFPSPGIGVYHLFFALLGVVFGQMVCLDFWFRRPFKIFGYRIRSVSRVLDSPQMMNWYFLSWFSKLAAVVVFLGVPLTFDLKNGFYYEVLAGLVVIVLWMQSWGVIRAAFGVHWKWLLRSGLILSILAFGLSKISLIDTGRIDLVMQKDLPFYPYTLELPSSRYVNQLSQKRNYMHLYVAMDDSIPVLLFEKKKISFFELPYFHQRHSEVYLIHADKRVKMDFLMRLEQHISNIGNKLTYVVYPEGRDPISRETAGINFRPFKALPDFYDKEYTNLKGSPPTYPLSLDSLGLVEQIANFRLGKHIIRVFPKGVNHCMINNELITHDELRAKLDALSLTKKNVLIEFYISDSMTLEEYISVMAPIKEKVMAELEKISQQEFGLSLVELTFEKKRQVYKKKNFSYLRIIPGMIKYMEQ